MTSSCTEALAAVVVRRLLQIFAHILEDLATKFLSDIEIKQLTRSLIFLYNGSWWRKKKILIMPLPERPYIIMIADSLPPDTVRCQYNAVRFLQNTHNRHTHSSPVRVRYGMFAVRLKSDSHSATVFAVLYAISWKIGPCYSDTRLFAPEHQ